MDEVKRSRVIKAVSNFIKMRHGLNYWDDDNNTIIATDDDKRLHFVRVLYTVGPDDDWYQRAKELVGEDESVVQVAPCPQMFAKSEEELLEELPWNYSGVVELRIVGHDRAILRSSFREEWDEYAVD